MISSSFNLAVSSKQSFLVFYLNDKQTAAKNIYIYICITEAATQAYIKKIIIYRKIKTKKYTKL